MGADKAVLGQMILDFSGNTLFFGAALFAVILIIVFVHEFGHYIVGRWCGVGVEAFSVGFGKELFGYTDAHGTRWKFCAIPLGGYVKFEGDANAASIPSTHSGAHTATSLHGKPVWQRAAVVAAGPLANFVLAIVILTGAFVTLGLPYTPAVVQELTPNGAAIAAGVKPGDIITQIDGNDVLSFEDISRLVRLRADEPLKVVIDRGGAVVNFTIVPKEMDLPDGLGGKVKAGALGIAYKIPDGKQHVRQLSLGGAFTQSVLEIKNQVVGLGQLFKKLIFGRNGANQLGGVVTIAKMAGTAASIGPSVFVILIAYLSISIGLINLFPVPILDGGHLVFYAIEAVLGKPLDAKAQEWSFRIGFAVILLFMAFVQINDISRNLGFSFGT